MSPWFYVPQRNPAASLRLFCFPYAGGNAAIFKPWAAQLGPHIELLAFQAPGRGVRFAEPPVDALDVLVGQALPALLPLLDRPAVFFGHSNGALVSYALASAVQERGCTQLRHLILSAKRAPQLPARLPLMSALPDGEFLRRLCEYGGIPEEVMAHPELLQLLLPALRADFALSERLRFCPGAPLDCNLTLFGGEHDRHVPLPDLYAWSELGGRTVARRIFAAGHFFIHTHAQQVLRELSDVLEQVHADLAPA